MKLRSVGTIIARRVLEIKGGKGIEIIIGKPRQFQGGTDYYCPYKISGLGSSILRYAGGIDAVQALQLALKMIGADLYTSDEAKAGQISWEGSRKGDLGFPVPDILRDLLPSGVENS